MTGADLLRQRVKLGLAQNQLGIDPSRACRIEHGKADRMLKGFETILNAYGFEIRPKPINYNAKPYELRSITREDLEAAQRIESIIQRALGEQQRG